ncbi:hypothetical protein PYCCODRAFT_1099672 [Trametes coccinea BRFM310]|uniref:Uncharacterized protein n=1 Tax=Trametes coccinea (strain BRFM310) TaxID=1353009 RepID=A0A1Y2I9S6_TRAC3|nr:hypothetical protein PYCCODRAFT_1099672 [Trametes coccinea BRFM310]
MGVGACKSSSLYDAHRAEEVRKTMLCDTLPLAHGDVNTRWPGCSMFQGLRSPFNVQRSNTALHRLSRGHIFITPARRKGPLYNDPPPSVPLHNASHRLRLQRFSTYSCASTGAPSQYPSHSQWRAASTALALSARTLVGYPHTLGPRWMGR